jgi:acyl-CoA reductase-like NAD-dependent aldehyde dehydrogenase
MRPPIPDDRIATPALDAGGPGPDGRPPEAARSGVPSLVSEARRAQAAWHETPIAGRLRAIRRLRHAIASHSLALAEAAGRPSVRNASEALVSEVLPLADACRFLERQAARLLRPRRPGVVGRPPWLWGTRSEVRREPLGVVLILGPSNYPLLLPGVQAIQALAAGNAVLWKPGAGGEPAARTLARWIADAGIDPRLCAVLPESEGSAREAIAAGVDRVVLTGSSAAGRAVLEQLAPRLVPATMELSGCDAAVVLADADLDLVARALAFALRLNGGATCLAPHRVFVPRDLAPDLARRLSEAVAAGPSRRLARDEARRIGPLVCDALGRGARLLSGQCLAEGGLCAPIVLDEVDRSSRLLREDPFGPVLGLVPVSHEDEALRLAADCPHGLGASLFGDPRRARDLASRLPVGVVQINDLIVPTADPRLPFGGRGASGFGVTRGAEGLLEMTAPKVVVSRAGRFRPHFEPLADADAATVRAFLLAAHGPSLAARAKGGLDLARRLLGRRPGSGHQPAAQPAQRLHPSQAPAAAGQETGR